MRIKKYKQFPKYKIKVLFPNNTPNNRILDPKLQKEVAGFFKNKHSSLFKIKVSLKEVKVKAENLHRKISKEVQ